MYRYIELSCNVVLNLHEHNYLISDFVHGLKISKLTSIIEVSVPLLTKTHFKHDCKIILYEKGSIGGQENGHIWLDYDTAKGYKGIFL